MINKQDDIIKHFTDKLSSYEYNMNYSNMDIKTDLDIVDSVISIVRQDLSDCNSYSPVKCMLERAQEKLDIVIQARKEQL